MNGNLAMSRAVGDFPLKPFVNSACDHRWGFLPPSSPEYGPLYCLLGSDGLFESLSYEDVMDEVKMWHKKQKHENENMEERSVVRNEQMEDLAEQLVKKAFKKGSTDNITAVVAFVE